MSEGADARAIGDDGIFKDAALENLNAIAERAVFNDGERTDAAACADAACGRATARRAR